MEIIILGFILFILGVGGTIVYDKYKEKATAVLKDQQARIAFRQEAVKQVKARASAAPKKKSQEEVLSELLRDRLSPKRTIHPGPFSAGLVKEGDMPTETQYMEELFDDVSINSTMTVQQLIAKIESMKKR